MRKKLTIYFDKSGEMLEQVNNWRIRDSIGEEENDFDDSLEFVSIYDGRNSARIRFKSLISNRAYSMFLSDFNDVIVAKKFIDNKINGIFKFIKKGTAQAIKLVIKDSVNNK